MANNYVKFSEALVGLTEEEEAWLRQELKKPMEWDTQGMSEESVESRFIDFCSRYDLDSPDDEWPDFTWDFAEDLSEFPGKTLVLYSEESGSVDQVCSLIQEFLRKFRPHKVFALQWAETCSKPRIGEFGGGAAVISADEIKAENTCHTVERFLGKNNQLMPTVDQLLGEMLEFFDKFFEGAPLHGESDCDCDSCTMGVRLRKKYSRLITRDEPTVEEEITSTLWNEFANGTYAFGGVPVESVHEDNGKVVLQLKNGKAYVVEARDATDEY